MCQCVCVHAFVCMHVCLSSPQQEAINIPILPVLIESLYPYSGSKTVFTHVAVYSCSFVTCCTSEAPCMSYLFQEDIL